MEKHELIDEMRNELFYYWLLRSVSASQPKHVYENFGFAVQTLYDDDPMSIWWIYQQVANNNEI